MADSRAVGSRSPALRPRIAIFCCLAVASGGLAWALAGVRAVLTVTVVYAAALLTVAAVGASRKLARAGRIRSLLSLGAPLTSDALRDALRVVTADPGLELYYRLPGHAEYVTSAGQAVVPAGRLGQGRAFIGAGTTDEHGFTVLVDTIEQGHRATRRLQRTLLDAAAPALENAWLQAILRKQVSDQASARSRTVRAFLAERRRLEGNLHDGTQASLYEARYHVRQARLQVSDPTAAACIDAASASLGEAIAELRALVRGIYPAGLRESGLGAALFTATSDFPIVVDITGDADHRTDEETATAGFFTVMDVLYIAARSRAETAKVSISATSGGTRIQIAYLPGSESTAPAAPGSDETDAWLAAEDRVRALEGTMEITRAETAVMVKADLPCAS